MSFCIKSSGDKSNETGRCMAPEARANWWCKRYTIGKMKTCPAGIWKSEKQCTSLVCRDPKNPRQIQLTNNSSLLSEESHFHFQVCFLCSCSFIVYISAGCTLMLLFIKRCMKSIPFSERGGNIGPHTFARSYAGLETKKLDLKPWSLGVHEIQ